MGFFSVGSFEVRILRGEKETEEGNLRWIYGVTQRQNKKQQEATREKSKTQCKARGGWWCSGRCKKDKREKNVFFFWSHYWTA